jgi:hypothetical protein
VSKDCLWSEPHQQPSIETCIHWLGEQIGLLSLDQINASSPCTYLMQDVLLDASLRIRAYHTRCLVEYVYYAYVACYQTSTGFRCRLDTAGWHACHRLPIAHVLQKYASRGQTYVQTHPFFSSPNWYVSYTLDAEQTLFAYIHACRNNPTRMLLNQHNPWNKHAYYISQSSDTKRETSRRPSVDEHLTHQFVCMEDTFFL